MIKTSTLIASALIAIGALSTPSFAQSISQYDIEQQRLNDVKQQTTDSGLNTINHPLDHSPSGISNHQTQRDLRLNGVYTQPDETLE
jgi:hypothetical protein